MFFHFSYSNPESMKISHLTSVSISMPILITTIRLKKFSASCMPFFKHLPDRKRYAEFLRIDFPRIPFPEKKADFDTLSKFGWELVQAHLLRKVPRLKLAELHGKGSDEVEAIRYSPQEQAIHFNKTQHFAPVTEDVWNFYIGGYQVMDKYLKSRKGRKLSLDEITHISAVANSLAFTIAQMAKIDTAYKSAFPDRG